MSRELLTASRARCLGVWLAATSLASALSVAMGSSLLAPPPARFDEALVRVGEGALLLCAGWAWLATTVITLDACRGRASERRGVPAALRRAVLAACGAVLVTGLAHPGHADGAPHDRPAPTALLHGLPLPDRASAVGHVGRMLARHARARDRAAPLLVRSGDTLWGLAEERLGGGTAWPRLYAANRRVVGADPDLIRPGQRLVLPHREESR